MTVLHSISGVVVSHRGRGRQLGIPTINVAAPANVPDGIYAGVVFWNTFRFPAAVFVGAAVTFGETERQVEAYLLDTPQAQTVDNWGEVRLELTHFIRPNQKFPDADTLRRQMDQDIIQIRQCLQESSKNN